MNDKQMDEKNSKDLVALEVSLQKYYEDNLRHVKTDSPATKIILSIFPMIQDAEKILTDYKYDSNGKRVK